MSPSPAPLAVFSPEAPAAPRSATIRIGVLGSGSRIAYVLKTLCAQDPGFVVTALHDPDPAARDAFNATLGVKAAAAESPEALTTSPDVDWVFVGSFNSLHAAHAIAAFRAGKHVFCEKPLALSLEEAEAMRAAWRASGRCFAFGLVLRYSPLYRQARNLVAAGRIGRLLSFEFNETLNFNHGGYIHGNWRRHRALAGTHLLEKCCHDIDLALWLVGDLPVRVASFGGCSFFTPENAYHAQRIGLSPRGERPYRVWNDRHGVDPFTADKSIVDHQVAILEFSRGVRASFHTQCQAAIAERRFYICGSEGTLRLDAYTGLIELRRVGWDEPLETFTPIAGDSHAGGDTLMARELADVLRGRRSPAAGFPEGIRSLTTALAIDEALDTGSVVDLRARWAALGEPLGG